MAKTDPETELAQAALKLLAKKPWPELTLAEVAKAAKRPLASLQTTAPNKAALLGLILKSIGTDIAKRYRRDPGSADARDRLLDVALTWFEVLAPHKRAVRSLYDGLKRDPLTLIAARADAMAAANWLFVLAEADTGPALPLRALALAGILARAIPVWLEDDKSLSKTMARLDQDLRRAENLFGGRRPSSTSEPSP
jgi:ubiquinone biosynthesis protein COQ9